MSSPFCGVACDTLHITKKGNSQMKMFLIATTCVALFLFTLWMLISEDDFLDNEIADPFGEGK